MKTITVEVSPGAVHQICNPNEDPHLIWELRHVKGELAAASVFDGFEYLLSDNINMTEATRRLRLLRAAWRKAAR